MPNYIPSGGIQNGQIIYDYHVYDIVGALSGTSGSDINMGLGKLFVSSSRNVGINTTTPLPAYQLVVNGDQLNIGKVEISGSGAELYVRNLITSSTATNFVTYNPTSGKFFTTSSNILGQYLLVGQTSSMLAPYLLIAQTSSMLAPYLLVAQTGAFATTASNIFKGNQTITGGLSVTGSTNLLGLSASAGGGFILTYNNATGQVSYTSSISALTPPDLSGYLPIAQTSSMLAPYLLISQTSSFATTGSNTFIGNQTITGSLTVSGGLTTLFNTRATGSFTGSFTGNLTGTSSFASTASQALTASYVSLIGNSNIEIDYVNSPGNIVINGTVGVQDGGGSTSQAVVLNFTDFITASVASGVATISVSSSILGGVQIQEDGSTAGAAFTLNFGDNVSASVAGNVATINGHTKVAKDGVVDPSNQVRLLNFSGSGISSVSVAGSTASIFIPATSGVIIQDNTANKGSNTTINFVGATVATSSGTATITITGGTGSPSVQSTTSTLVPTASSFIFSGSGVVATQVNTNTASIHIPGTAGSNGNIQYNSGSSPAGATTFNFISSSNQVQLTGSLIVSNSGGTYILSSSGAVFSSSLYATSSVFFTGLTTTSSVSNILTFNPTSGQLYYTSSDEYQQIRVKSGSNITSSRMLEFTGSGVSVTFSANPVTASINIPSYINPGPTGYLSFYSGSTSQSLHPVSASNQVGVFWNIANNRLGINKITPEYTLEVSGSFGATTKSFIISHKTQKGKYLQYGVTEGPEHSVFVRGKSNSHIIELPEEWTWLVDQDTITVNLTSVGEHQDLCILDIIDNKVIVGSNTLTPNFHYQVFAERKDVPKLKTII
jgi:hypothetical protein